jgi:hypothetical protein
MRAVGAEPVWALARGPARSGKRARAPIGAAGAVRRAKASRCLCSGPRRRPTQHDRTAGDRSGGPVRWSSMVLSDGGGDGCARPTGGRLLTPRDGVRFPAAGERRRGLSAPGCDDIADGTTPATGFKPRPHLRGMRTGTRVRSLGGAATAAGAPHDPVSGHSAASSPIPRANRALPAAGGRRPPRAGWVAAAVQVARDRHRRSRRTPLAATPRPGRPTPRTARPPPGNRAPRRRPHSRPTCRPPSLDTHPTRAMCTN